MHKLLFIVLFGFIARPVLGQFNCIDTGRINPMYMCNDQYYNPVCGCNGVTYRNVCASYNVFGVNTVRSGVCDGIDMDFYPNPVGPFSFFTINLSFPEFIYGNADIKVVNMYGKTVEQRILNNFNRTSIELDPSTWMTGVYLIVVRSSLNTSVVRKFAKY